MTKIGLMKTSFKAHFTVFTKFLISFSLYLKKILWIEQNEPSEYDWNPISGYRFSDLMFEQCLLSKKMSLEKKIHHWQINKSSLLQNLNRDRY